MPRTSQEMVNELHALLGNGGIQGPYLLVGHSLGGFNVRLFAHQYPDETAGIVLVASGNEHEDARMPPEYKKIEESNMQADCLLFTLTASASHDCEETQVCSLPIQLTDQVSSRNSRKVIALTFYRPSTGARLMRKCLH